MLTMILLPLCEVMVPEEEIDPGPYPHSISFLHKLNYLPRLILPEVLVLFMTWISYRLIPWYHNKLRIISNQVPSFSLEGFKSKYKFKEKYSSTMPIHLYHDHYMIDVSKKIYLYHHHYMIGMINIFYFKLAYSYNRKAVRFKSTHSRV